MKKSFLFFCTLCTSVLLYADGLTATLQQGEKMTPFYGVDAFYQAYQAADSGAVITLSAGTFTRVDTIKKSLTIIGSGAMSIGNQYNTSFDLAYIVADNVVLEGVRYTNLYLSNINNCLIKRSYIQHLRANAYHTNTLIEQSYIGNEYALGWSKNYSIRNSYIGKFSSSNNASNIAYITNNYINNFNNSVRPVAIYKKNIFECTRISTYNNKNYTVSLTSPSEFYDNMILNFGFYYVGTYYTHSLQGASGTIFENNRSGTITTNTTHNKIPTPNYLALDSTYIGPLGGMGVSDYPAIPRIISKKIDEQTNEDGKINISITVNVEK